MINNLEKTGVRNLFDVAVLPFTETRPFYFPSETAINNIEES